MINISNVENLVKSCNLCPLHKTLPEGCTPVSGFGPSKTKLMIIGEAPGEDESYIGKPFQGQCGRLLNNMLKEAGLERENIYIDNIVHCRPVKQGKKGYVNRPPTEDEINICKHWTYDAIRMVSPEVIFTLGMVATKVFLTLKSNTKLGDIIGKEFDWYPVKVVPMYHPSYVMVHSRKDYNTCVEIFKKYKDLI